MTGTGAIAIITAELASLDDERIMTVAEIVRNMADTTPMETTPVVLDLTGEERPAVERSWGDFKAGRTFASEHYAAEMTAFMADIKSRHP
jgi:hypothetical protein